MFFIFVEHIWHMCLKINKMNASVELLKIKAKLTLEKEHLIQESEIPEILRSEFPIMNEALERTIDLSNVYRTVQCFADFTKLLIRNGKLKEVKHCFKVADKMLQQGNNSVKNAIENCYVFSISTLFDIANPVSVKVKSMLTDSLKKEYLRQVNSSST